MVTARVPGSHRRANDVNLIEHSKQDMLTTMPGRTLVLCSPLSPDECVARLDQLIARPGRFPSGSNRPLIGRVHGSGMRLTRNHGLWSGRQAVYELSGTLNATQMDEQSGTRIVGRFRADRSSRIFQAGSAVIGMGVLISNLPNLFIQLNAGQVSDPTLVTVSLALGFLLLPSLVILPFSLLLREGDISFMTTTLINTLDAQAC